MLQYGRILHTTFSSIKTWSYYDKKKIPTDLCESSHSQDSAKFQYPPVQQQHRGRCPATQNRQPAEPLLPPPQPPHCQQRHLAAHLLHLLRHLPHHLHPRQGHTRLQVLSQAPLPQRVLARLQQALLRQLRQALLLPPPLPAHARIPHCAQLEIHANVLKVWRNEEMSISHNAFVLNGT